MAQAVAGQAVASFFSVSSNNLVSKYVGDSERLVAQLFSMAQERAPSVIFIDEVGTWHPHESRIMLSPVFAVSSCLSLMSVACMCAAHASCMLQDLWLLLSVASAPVSPCLVMHIGAFRAGQVKQLKQDVDDSDCRWMPCAVRVEMGTTRLQGV